MSESRGLCNCCAKFILSLGLIVLIFWLSFRFTKPRYYLISFSLPPSNSSSSSFAASFHLQIENKNRQIGIYHDSISLTLLSGPNLSSPLSQFLVPAFYQGHLKTADKPGNFTAGNRTTRFAGGSLFRVAANSAFRFKVLAWKSRHHAVSVAGEVEIDAAGEKTAKKGIRLSSCADVAVPPVVVPVGFFLYALVLLA